MKKHKILILIVEDNKHNQHLYKDAFEKKGFEPVFVNNADGFFPEEVSKVAPDIISMDLMLGADGIGEDRDGFEAMAVLKADLRTAHIPIVVLTNFFEEGKVRRAKELGAVDFLNTAALSINRVPEHFLRYLKDPEHYKPSHPLFRE
jgi:CheY-like chemotaxis protein